MNFIIFLVILGCIIYLKIGHSSSRHKHEDYVSVFIDTSGFIGETDEDYVCATMDYFTSTSELNISLLNLDLNSRVLVNAVKAFSPLRLRVGGTLQDRMTYETLGQQHQPCLSQFVQNSSQLFGFNQACLTFSRWDQLNNFFNTTGAVAVFGLNALKGKTILSNGSAVGAWDSSNAESLIRYTFNKGYNIFGWELGNELNGRGVGAGIGADQYASDIIVLENMVQAIYNGARAKPIVAAPGGFFDPSDWFVEFFNKTTKSLQVITHHIYNLGAGEDNDIMEKILDPSYLDGGTKVYKDLQNMLKNLSSSTVAWVGEAGGAYHGGHNLVTNAFVMSFWYLDQLGMAASYNTKTYCRQALIGDNYGLLNTTTFNPNPDYYSALLWNRLMGQKALATRVNGTKTLRAYTHCSRQSEGITLLLLNIDNKPVEVNVSTQEGSITGPLKIGKKHTNKWSITREEYHLTAPNGDLHSQTIQLNGEVLSLTSSGEIPQFKPYTKNSLQPLYIGSYSILFVRFSGISSPACVGRR